jgi:DNA-binding XRE family transcriptional regulator
MHIPNRLAYLRSTWSLTQEELGLLLGVSGDTIGNYELAERHPSISLALGLEIVLGARLATLFPIEHQAKAREIVEGAQAFGNRLVGSNEPIAKLKEQYLRELGERLDRIIP